MACKQTRFRYLVLLRWPARVLWPVRPRWAERGRAGKLHAAQRKWAAQARESAESTRLAQVDQPFAGGWPLPRSGSVGPMLAFLLPRHAPGRLGLELLITGPAAAGAALAMPVAGAALIAVLAATGHPAGQLD